MDSRGYDRNVYRGSLNAITHPRLHSTTYVRSPVINPFVPSVPKMEGKKLQKLENNYSVTNGLNQAMLQFDKKSNVTSVYIIYMYSCYINRVRSFDIVVKSEDWHTYFQRQPSR